MRWSVYRVEQKSPIHGKVLIGLGYVNAKHQPQAVRAAWKRWPQYMDRHQVQAGFSIRPYLEDRLSLGKLTAGS